MKKVLILSLLCLATIAYADVGSVINSFRAGTATGYKMFFGMARDKDYVYYVHYDALYNEDYLIVRTPGGGWVRSLRIFNVNASPWSADNAHLGAGYVALYGISRIYVLDGVTGSTVTSFSAYGYRGCCWDGVYYYTADRYGGTFYRYTSSGNPVGSWSPAGWPSELANVGGCGFSRYARNAEGRYLVASPSRNDQPFCIVDINTGSLIATWNMGLSGIGGACGPAYPPSYGDSYWAMLHVGGNDFWVFQIDIEGRYVGINPSSLGKIKALYR